MTDSGPGPTLKDLGEQLGISATAVSMALNNRPGVSEELRDKVLALARKRGYRPNYAARALRIERSNILGLINRNLHNPGFLAIFDGFNQACAEQGFQVLVGASALDPTSETSLIDAVAAHRLDGLAIAPIDLDVVLSAWRRRTDRPIVFLNSGTIPAGPDTMSVQADGRRAVALALEHLLALGHRRVALLTNRRLASGSMRIDEFRRLMRRHRLHPAVIGTTTLGETVELLVRRLRRQDRPTAIITDSDALAHQTYEAAALLGLRIPDQLSVVGHDDLPTSPLLGPALTTIAVDRFAIGRRAAALLIDSITGTAPAEPHVQLDVSLVARASTARPAATAR